MTSPFPGMDPYLENPTRWQSVHPQLVSGLPALIEPLLPEGYALSVEERVYLSLPGDDSLRLRRPDAMVIDTAPWIERGGAAVATVPRGFEVLVPDEEPVRELYLTVRAVGSDSEVITVIEVLSPTNKLPGPGRDEYLSKRGAVLATRTNLVEIDLLRYGARMPAGGAPGGFDYGILICRGASRPRAELLAFSLREAIPAFPLPLRPGEAEPPVELAAALSIIYRSNRLGLRIDYSRPPEPPLSPADEQWAGERLRAVGLHP